MPHGEQTSERGVLEQHAVRVVRRDRHRALAHVQEALRDPHHKQRVLALLVVGRQLTQHARDARIVGAAANEAETKNGGLRHLLVAVVRKLRERVHHGHRGVAERDQRQCERNRAADDGLAVLQQPIEHSQRHVTAQLLAHRDQRNADDGHRLEAVILLQMLAAHLQHLLHAQHIAGARIRTALHGERRVLGDGLVLERLECFEGDVGGVLPAEVQQPEAQAQEARKGRLQRGVVALKEQLQNPNELILGIIHFR